VSNEYNYTIALVPPERVREAWKQVKGHLQPAIDVSHGRWQPEYVLAALALNEQQLWVVIDSEHKVKGAVTSQIAAYPEKNMLSIHFLGGEDFDEWYQYLLDVLTRYAKDTGCSAIECVARAGFWKWFQRDGFEKTSVFYEKMI
jgi:hypothetical protein